MIRILNSIFYLSCLTFLLLLTNCKKDNANIVEQKETSTSENWLPTQKVKISKVEFRAQENVQQYYSDSVIVVNYLYNADGSLRSIQSNLNFETSGISEIFKVSETGKNIFIENFSETCHRYPLVGFILASNDIKIFDDKVTNINGRVNQCTFGFISSSKQEFNSSFSYDKRGMLSSINSYFDFLIEGIPPLLIKEINSIVYDFSNSVKSLKVISHSTGENPYKTEDYLIQFDYHAPTNIPDGLVRIVNQSILELNSLGYNEIIFDHFYLMGYTHAFKRGFSDWICAFGLPELQTIPTPNAGLISKKHITGIRGDYNDTTNAPIFVDIDVVTNFPYIHDEAAKTLEIAGLKIWYELVE